MEGPDQRDGEPIYIVVGNHRSILGIQEIVHSLQSSLTKSLSVRISSNIKNNAINVIIDEFSLLSDATAMKQTKELYPDTKLVLVATEFITPVSLFGVELFRTFNFFGRMDDWLTLLTDGVRSLRRRAPSYMRQRYLGFVEAVKHCDLVVAVHVGILPGASELLSQCASRAAPPLLVYPQIGPLTVQQQNRLRTLPIGFTMTGTMTRYRAAITRKLIDTFELLGWSGPVFKHVPFEQPPVASSVLDELHLAYNSIYPEYLFNLNPAQSAKWSYSSPMRILRAILLGQIPVVTKRFRDHPLEDVALLWDTSRNGALDLAAFTIRDRDGWLDTYVRSISAYDELAEAGNRPFVRAIKALAGNLPLAAPAVSPAEPDAVVALNRPRQRR